MSSEREMMSRINPKCEFTTRQDEIACIQAKISSIDIELFKLTQNFHIQAGKLQRQINKVQFSRPRGNPANIWPHRPMTTRVRQFYQAKEGCETFLRNNMDLLKLSFDHSKAIITSKKAILESELSDTESQIKLLKIHYPFIKWNNMKEHEGTFSQRNICKKKDAT